MKNLIKISEKVEALKAAALLIKIAEVDKDSESEWEISYNQNSGYTYAYSEPYAFTLVITDCYYWSELKKDEVEKYFFLHYSGLEVSERYLHQVDYTELNSADKNQFTGILKQLKKEGNTAAALVLESMEEDEDEDEDELT